MAFITPGEKLRILRKQLNIKQKQLEDANISRDFISMFESNKRKLSEESAKKIIELLKNIANEKGININSELSYLYLSQDKAAEVYCMDKLNSLDKYSDISEVDEVINICKEYNFEDILGKTNIIKGDILYNNTEYRNAIYYYLDALEIYIRNRKGEYLSEIYNKLGKCRLELINYEEALMYLEKAYEYGIVLNNSAYKRKALFNIALTYKKLYRIDEALINIDRFITLIDKKSCLDDYINAIIMKANCFVAKGNNIKAMYLYEDLEKLILNELNPLLGYIYNNLGSIYFNLQDFESSLEYFNKAQNLRMKVDRINLAHTLTDKAEVFMTQLMYDQAIQLLEESIELATEYSDTLSITQSHSLLERIYTSRSDRNKLENVYLNELVILKNTGNIELLVNVLGKLALLYLESGELDLSKKYLNDIILIKGN